MNGQSYFLGAIKELIKSRISKFVKIYTEKLFPVFEDIEKEANEYEKTLFDEAMHQPACSDFSDPASIAENVRDESIDYYSYLYLGRYNLTAAWHATLYQLWEQQVRWFLFRNIPRVKKLDFKKFCTKPSEMKENFKSYHIDIEKFSCWPKIEELRLLCNTIKHGEGNSSKKLRKINPALFKQEGGTDYMQTFRTTLLEETLNINGVTLEKYRNALLSFWDEIPE